MKFINFQISGEYTYPGLCIALSKFSQDQCKHSKSCISFSFKSPGIWF